MNLADDRQAIVPVVRRPEYTLGLEQANQDTAFLHCTIHVPWTGRVRRNFASDLEQLFALHGGPLYALVRPDDDKLQHFVRLFGGELVAPLTDLTTGRTHLLFIKR